MRAAMRPPEPLAKVLEASEGPVVFGPAGDSALALFDLGATLPAKAEWVVAGVDGPVRVSGVRVRRVPSDQAAAWLEASLTPLEVGFLMVLESDTWDRRCEEHEEAVERLSLQVRLGRVRRGALMRAASQGPPLALARLREVLLTQDDG